MLNKTFLILLLSLIQTWVFAAAFPEQELARAAAIIEKRHNQFDYLNAPKGKGRDGYVFLTQPNVVKFSRNDFELTALQNVSNIIKQEPTRGFQMIVPIRFSRNNIPYGFHHAQVMPYVEKSYDLWENFKRHIQNKNQVVLDTFEELGRCLGEFQMGYMVEPLEKSFRTASHGDFHLSNIIRTSTGFTLIDNCYFKRESVLTIDPIYLFSTLMMYEQAYSTTSHFQTIIDHFYQGYLTALSFNVREYLRRVYVGQRPFADMNQSCDLPKEIGGLFHQRLENPINEMVQRKIIQLNPPIPKPILPPLPQLIEYRPKPIPVRQNPIIEKEEKKIILYTEGENRVLRIPEMKIPEWKIQINKVTFGQMQGFCLSFVMFYVFYLCFG